MECPAQQCRASSILAMRPATLKIWSTNQFTRDSVCDADFLTIQCRSYTNEGFSKLARGRIIVDIYCRNWIQVCTCPPGSRCVHVQRQRPPVGSGPLWPGPHFFCCSPTTISSHPLRHSDRYTICSHSKIVASKSRVFIGLITGDGQGLSRV